MLETVCYNPNSALSNYNLYRQGDLTLELKAACFPQAGRAGPDTEDAGGTADTVHCAQTRGEQRAQISQHFQILGSPVL